MHLPTHEMLTSGLLFSVQKITFVGGNPSLLLQHGKESRNSEPRDQNNTQNIMVYFKRALNKVVGDRFTAFSLNWDSSGGSVLVTLVTGKKVCNKGID